MFGQKIQTVFCISEFTTEMFDILEFALELISAETDGKSIEIHYVSKIIF